MESERKLREKPEAEAYIHGFDLAKLLMAMLGPRPLPRKQTCNGIINLRSGHESEAWIPTNRSIPTARNPSTKQTWKNTLTGGVASFTSRGEGRSKMRAMSWESESGTVYTDGASGPRTERTRPPDRTALKTTLPRIKYRHPTGLGYNTRGVPRVRGREFIRLG